jgi:hypothetical protein
MAFDLNKNDGTVNKPSVKTPSAAKFDLSKSEPAAVLPAENHPSSKTWIIGLIGVLIIGGGIWYYSVQGKGNDLTNQTTAQTSMADSVATAVTQINPTTGTAGPDSLSGNLSAKNGSSASVSGNDVPDANVSETAGTGGAGAPVNQPPSALNKRIPATFGQGSASLIRINQTLIKRILAYLNSNPGNSSERICK